MAHRGIQDDERRREQAVRARETVLAAHLTEHTVEGWVTAWQQAIDNRAQSAQGRLTRTLPRGVRPGSDGHPRVPSRSTGPSFSSRASMPMPGWTGSDGRRARTVASTRAGSGTEVSATPRSSKRRAAVSTDRS